MPSGSAGCSIGVQPRGSNALPNCMSPTRMVPLVSPASATLRAEHPHRSPAPGRSASCDFVSTRASSASVTCGTSVRKDCSSRGYCCGRSRQPRPISRSSGCEPYRVRPGLQIIRMQRHGVALLAQHRDRRDQQGLLVGTVHVVAVEAVFAHRRVLEQERPALLRVAGVAGLVDRVGLQQRLGDAAVRIVAIGAGDLPFRQRHVRAAVELGADVLVAGRARPR